MFICPVRKITLFRKKMFIVSIAQKLTNGFNKWKKIWYTGKQSDYGTVRRASPSRTACIPIGLAGYGKTVRPWPLLYLSHFSALFMQLGTSTGKSPLDREQVCLLLAVKAVDFSSSVFLSCNTKPLHAVRPSGPHWVPLWNLGRGVTEHAGDHAICCAAWVMQPLSLTQESYVFCYHPWNSNKLTY